MVGGVSWPGLSCTTDGASAGFLFVLSRGLELGDEVVSFFFSIYFFIKVRYYGSPLSLSLRCSIFLSTLKLPLVWP